MNITLMILAGTIPFVSGDVILPGTPTPDVGGGQVPSAARSVPGVPSVAVATEAMASRLVTGPVEPQIALLRSRLAITGNDRGPFGFFQDPKKAEEQDIMIPQGPSEQPKETPFEDVVNSIPISIVSPAEQQFMVGARTFTTGDEFPIEIAGESIPVRVVRVRMRSVTFRNTKTDKTAAKGIDLDPKGVVEAKGGKIDVPGLTREKDSRKAPLPLDLKQPDPTTTTIGRSR